VKLALELTMDRRAFIEIAILAPLPTFAQQTMESTFIGIGPFEFPIAGRFNYSKSNGATLISVEGSDRTYTVGMFRDRSTAGGEDGIARFAALSQANWERFAASESGVIVRPFRRTDLPGALSILSMATEFGTGKSRRYYLQFAATNGSESAVIFVEGDGPASGPLAELDPLVAQVRVVRQ
jgi:hypothetical protein